MSSPVKIGDSIYVHLKNQRFTSLGASDGEIHWTSSPFGKYWSMISNGSKILALDNSGELMLINAADSKFDVADKMKVANDAWAHLAIEGNLLIVRDLAALKVYRWE